MRTGRSIWGLASAALSAACLALIIAAPLPAAASPGGSGPALLGDGGTAGSRDTIGPAAVVAAPPRATYELRRPTPADVSRVVLVRPVPVGRLRDFAAPPPPWSGSPLLLPVRLAETPPAD